MKNKYLQILLMSLSQMSCIEVNNIITPGDRPVIEAYLAPGSTVSMKVYTEIPYTSEDSAYSKPVEGLKIKITGDDGLDVILTEKEEGTYVSTQKLGKAGTTYKMSFSHNNRTISAETTLPQAPENFKIDLTEIARIARDFSAGFTPGQGGPGGGFQQETNSTINITWDNPDNVYHFVAAQSIESNPTQILIPPPSNGNFPARPARRFNNQPVLTNSSSINGQSFEYFGRYAIILYRLNPDYAALYENTSTTSQNIATPVSTITNGLGIFTGINADTLILNVKKKQ
ncbi:DUF4249 family protein [Lacihabitans sp. CS3-21]|uniref:DUF4249 family protein n=1 Tax=Lacihabitans sp. CS3-21 TaxID=2487332 RepID=UPI0020CD5DB1|nr:DUF4249 family protein [Lacihabitans sp. CS3-21]MCP9749200.1 DUF4249 family protein [Lacihabitans sp. CS3-21]